MPGKHDKLHIPRELTKLRASPLDNILRARDNIHLSRDSTYLSRESTYLSQREKTFFNLREPTIWAAEDGRKRASTLPPLEREPTFQRKPKHFNPHETNDEAGESHWKKGYEKVSIEVDNKVKNHLKRQLLLRFDKRLKKMEDAMADEMSGRHGKDYNPWEGKQGKKKSKDLFSKYTETGGKTDDVVDGDLKSTADILPDIHRKHGLQLSDDQKQGDLKVQFPNINQNGDSNDFHSDGDESIESKHGEDDNDNINLEHKSEEELFDLTRLRAKYSDENFRNLDVSPIQTPHVVRPMTREQTRLSFDDRMNRILHGDVHVTCPIQNKIIKIYLSSGFADSEAERTVLLERLYPELRTLCLLHGRELQMVDPHWGLQDAVTDDHSIPDVCLSNLHKCTRDYLQHINVIVILTDRYGDTILPSLLQIEEFELVHSSVSAYTSSQKAEIRRQLAVLERTTSLLKLPLEDGSQKVEINGVNGVNTDHEDQSETKNQIQEKAQDTGKNTTARKEGDQKKEQELIKALKDRERSLPGPELLDTWYKLDENLVPPAYRLQTISSILKDFGKSETAKREYARQVWLDTQSKLLDMLNRFGSTKYNKSLLDLELEQVLHEHEHGFEQCVVINRQIDDIDSNLEDLNADEYADVLPGRPRKMDWDVHNRLRKIKQEIIPQKISDQNILPFQVQWAAGGVRIGGDRMHQTYLDRMEKHVCEVSKRRLLEGFKEDAHERNENSALFEEIAEHVIFYQERSSNFQGMKETLHIIKAYLRSRCRSPLVVHGNPGSGKSAVLAKAAKETHRWLKGKDVAVLVRSVGSTKESTNVRKLLYCICQQLCVVYDVESSQVPTDYIGLINDLSHRLGLATERKPLVLFIDALDRLDDDHGGRKLAWLPKTLPDNVHLILSTLPDEKSECMPSLKSLLGNDDDVFLEIPELQESDTMIILNHWCNKHNHTLTHEQFDIIFNVTKKCSSPLFLKLLFNESLNWTSYTVIQESKLPDTVKRMAAVKFGQMEIKYGESLVRRAIGYLTASRNGLTDHEMLDLLSLDDAVMSDIALRYNLVRRRVPSSLWYRLRADLSLYIKEISADNVKTLQWSHSHFYEAAKERYLQQRDKAPSYHKAMSEFFLGTWVDKPKPYPGNDKGAMRYVADQPLYWQPKDAPNDGSQRIYNLRKINELPYHLLRSSQILLYKTETMCNFEWILAKLCGTSLRSLVEEYHIALEMEPADLDLKLMSDTLQLSATAIQRDPRQLAGQIVGRLQGIVNRDIPSTPGDPPKYPLLHAMITQAKNTSIPALVPSIGCLTEPGGILYDLLSGHTKPITAVTTTTDAQRALTSSEDDTLKVWDLKSGKVTSTIDGFGKSVSKLRTALNNKYVIAVEGSVIRVWSLMEKVCCLVVDQYIDPPVISVASEGKLLVAFFDGVNALRTWDLSDEFKHVCETKIEDHHVFSDNSVVLAPNSYGDYVLHAFRGGNSATIQHARTGKIVHKLKCNDSSSSIVALAITRDYMILACRQQYMKLHEIHQLEMFDAKKGKYLRSIRGCTQDIITEVHINLVGSHAIVICASETTNASNIAIWNLETEDHKHLAKHSGVSTVSACADFRYCLTAQKGDNTLKIWNISKFINQSMPKLKKSLGVAEIHPMIDNPRYAIARQVNHGPISIWNVAKAKCLASAVRIERGLSESSDVVLIRNCNVVILTEKGLKDSKPVFKTVLIYDLRAKRYVKKITQCFIVPSPAHEYVLLDDETLLGPAETRNHFVIWSLVTGKEMFRIKPSYKDSDLKGNIREADIEHCLQLRASTAKLTPWERRTESQAAKQKRREQAREQERMNLEEIAKEKQNGIEQFIISGDLNVIVASFFAHHLAVFNLETKLHTQTLESESSMLFLHVAALNHDGSSLVLANYDETSKVSYVTLWDTQTGHIKKRLKNETDVLAIAITDDGSRVVFGKANKELRIWDPDAKHSQAMKKVKGYDSLQFSVGSKIFTLSNGTHAVVFAGDISLWDLENATLLAAFTPDTRIEVVNVVMSGQLITIGVHEFAELIVLKMSGKDVKPIMDTEHNDLFGETTGDTSDEEEEDEEDDL